MSTTPHPGPSTRHPRIEFESLAQTTSVAIFLTQDQHIVYANPAVTSITGYPYDELLGLDLWQLAHPDYQAGLRKLGMAQAWVKDVPSRYELKIVTRRGEERWLDLTMSDVDYGGERAVVVTAFDITERDRAERALRATQRELEARVQARTAELAAANEKLNSVLSSITEAYVALDSDWRFLAVNPLAERDIFGRPARELIGKIIWDEYPQTVGQEVDRQYRRAVKTGQPVHFETPSRIVPGRWFEVHAYPQGTGLEAYFHDITGRKQAETEIANLARFPAENPNPVLRLDQDGDLLYANGAGQMLLQTWARTTDDKALAYWRTLTVNALANQDRPNVEIVCDGRTFSISVTPIVEAGYVNLYGRDITERKQAESALQTTVERFFTILSNLYSSVLLVTDEGRVEFANQPFCDFYGLVESPTDLVGISARDMLEKIRHAYQHPDEAVARIQAIVDRGQPVKGEELAMQGGQTCLRDFVPVSIQGKSYGRLWIHYDITARKQAEEALRESEERFHSLFETMNEGFILAEVVTDNQGKPVDYRYLDVNPAGERFFGRSREELVGHTYKTIGGANADPEWIAALCRVALTGEPASIERYAPVGGQWVHLLAYSPRSGQFAAIFDNITVRKRSEDALRLSEERFRIALQGAPITVATLDRDLRYTWVYNTRHGFKPEQVLGKRPDELIPPEDAAKMMALLHQVLETGVTARSEVSGHTYGQRWVYDMTAEPLRGAAGQVVGLTIANIDITERKQKEIELQKLNRALTATSNSNQAMMKAVDEAEYLKEVCKIVVHDCGYPMVWIGFAEQDEGQTVRPVAYAGFEAGYLETLKITWADTERGRGPTGTAIRTGKPSGCNNMLTDPDFKPWRAEAIKRGYASSFVFPLLANGAAFGAITLYSRDADSFTVAEVKLLTELASDLAYGITTLRLRAEHARAEEARRLSEERYRSLFTSMTEGFALHEIICDEQGQPCDYRFLEINPAFEQLTGLKRDTVIGRSHNELLPDDDPLWVEIYGAVALTGQSTLLENYSPALKQHYEVYAYCPAPRQFAVLFKNITERKRMEAALRAAHAELEQRVQDRTRQLAQANEELSKEMAERERAESQLRLQMTAVRAAANGIVITDRQGAIQWCNPAFTRMTGYEAAEALGQSFRLLNSGQQSAEFYRALWDTIASGEVWHGELVNRRKDGHVYVEEQTIAPVLDERGAITHFIAIKHDITERKQAEARLERYNQDLLAVSQAERAQRQLAETLSAASLALTQSLNLDTVLEALLDYVGQLVPYDSANVLLLETESRLVVHVTRGYERWANPAAARTATFDVQTNRIFEALLTTRQSCLIADTRAYPGWETRPGVEHVRSWLGVPLIAGGHVIGLYSLDKIEPDYFRPEHQRMAELLVGQAAVAIQNAWLFEQVRAGRERLQSLSRRLVEAQEAERHYVARELHDEAGQALTSLLFGLRQLEPQLADPTQAAQVAELKQITNGLFESLHRLAADLRPASLDHLGLVPVLQQYLKVMGERYGLIAQFKAVGFEGERLSVEIETALYRIVQEAVTNIGRHARATRADVLLERRDERVVVVVEDNGLGFDTAIGQFAQEGHLGLVGMQERVEMLGGSLTIESAAGTGTTIVVEVPNDDSHSDR